MTTHDGVEVLLCVERTSKEKSQVAFSLDDVCDLVDGLMPIKGVLESEQAVFHDIRECGA